MLKKLSPPILFLAWLISVTDGQNKPPVCNQTYISRSIIEGVPIGTTVLNFRDFCSDPEGGPLKYQLNDNANQQFIATTSNLLNTNKVADAEARLSYAPSFYASPWTLRVTMRDNKSAACVFTVLVNIVSINDNPATIKNMVVPPVREDTTVGTIIGNCTLVDGDYPNSGHDIPYVEIIAGNEDKKFGVDEKTCYITLLSPLDYETNKSYNLTFRAYNFPNDTNATTNKQTITVVDVNDNAPTCKSYNIIMDVPEDKVTNDVLLNLDCWDVDSSNNGVIEFFSDTPGNSYPLKVDQKSGDIVLTKDLDYDLDLANRNMEIAVRVTDKGVPPRSATVTVAFRVLDVDDQPPQFTQRSYSTAMLETCDLGYVALTVGATDKDTPNTALSEITFGLETPCSQDWFLIEKHIGAILVSSLLDWETEPTVSCLVYAYSSDKYKDRTFANVSITLVDVNDRAPQFTQYLFEGSVVENAPGFTSVVNVTAYDPEDGVNGQFTYSLLDDSPFAIDENTGLVYVKDSGIVDYETKVDYLLLVTAVDKGTPSLTSYARISILVEPVNEFTPVFTNLSDIQVSELTWPGTLLTTIHVQDGDAGDDGIVEFSLQDSTSPFMLHKQTGSLFAGIGLDYEVAYSYTLLMTVVDKSKTTVKSSTGSMNVIIVNENEHDPTCETAGPIIVTPNSHNTGDLINQLNCTDLDSNTVLQFAILRGNSNMFGVDSSTGVVTFQTSPAEGCHLLVIGVSDQGKPARMTEVFVEIDVETLLKFRNLPARTSTSEDASINSLVYSVSAVGAYENLTYEIISANEDRDFNLHQAKGDLRVVGKLDRETTDRYTITIRATTKNGQIAQDTLIIDIDDINDNCPVYNSSFDYIRVSDILPVPCSLKKFTATDEDINQNAEVVYSILSGDPGNMFSYTATGELQLRKQLDYKTQPFYEITLLATDKGNPLLNSTMLVDVEVLNENDSLKIVSSGGTIPLSLPEDTAIGVAVVKIQVQNNDASSELTFTITSGNSGNNFTINERTGEVTPIYALDRETADVMTIGVRVYSSSGKTDTTTLVMNITDVNDNCPVFNPDNYVFSVPHGTSAGSILGPLFVTDSDAGVNQVMSFSITSGDPNNRFNVSGKMLIAAALLDANVASLCELEILAKDHGTLSLNSTVKVSILIQPEVKIPEFSPKADQITIDETCLPGNVLYDTNATYRGATERSLNHTGDLVYSLMSGDTDTFFVNPDNGEVQLIGPLSFSLKTSHTLIITAVSKVNASLCDYFTLTVIILQINMHNPAFSLGMFIFNVSENAGVGTVVGQVTATDNDTGQYGKLSYHIESNNHFGISPSKGVLTLISPLDHSAIQSYSLLVTATDNAGNKSRTASRVVFIHVIDTNNCLPEFKNTPYVVTVPESMPVGSVVSVVVAEDLDSGLAGTVSYFIISGNAGGQFALNSSTGMLTLSSNLDFESSRLHILIIQGRDGGTPSLSASVTVKVYVADENDNAPRFKEACTDLLIRRDSPAMTRVFQVSASDKNTGKNAVVRYSIQSGDNDDLFNIDALTGGIITARPLTLAGDFYTLIIGGFDQSWPQLSATTTVSIALTPIRNVPTGDYVFKVRENESVGTFVGSVANDPSLHLISGYSIICGNYDSAYTITMNANKEGILLTNIVLNREAYSYYKLHVAVEHASGIKHIDLVVSVLDVNDNAPVIEPSTLEVSMVENLAPGNTVGALAITDADEAGINNQWDLSISPPGSTGNTHFSVSPSGAIKVVKSVSYEAFSVVRFYVVAVDRGDPRLSATATVVVHVLDVLETVEYTGFDTASFISLEFPDDATEEDLCTLKASHVGLNPGPGDVVKFITVGTDSVFSVQASTNTLVVQRPSLIFTLARYIQWVIVELTSAGVTTPRALMVRLDTFKRDQHTITAVVDTDVADLRSKIETLRLELQAFFQPPQVVRIWKTQSTTQQGRRRLLSASSEALFVVVADEAADNMSNIKMAKRFLSNTDAVKPLQASPDGTPVQRLATVSPPVISVLPYPKPNSTESTDDLDPAFVAVIVMGCAAVVALIFGVIAFVAYCVCYRRSEKRDDKEGLVTSDNTESRKESFQTIGQADLDNSQTQNGNPIFNTLHKPPEKTKKDSINSSRSRSRIRSRSVSVGDANTRQRNISVANGPSIDPTDQGTSRSSHESSISSMLHKTSVKQDSSTSSRVGVKAVTRSHSMTSGQPASRQRKITPVNEPAIDPTGFLEVPSKSTAGSSLLDDSRSEGSSKATSITVSSAGQSLRAPSTITSGNSSTMLESLEVDVFSSAENVSLA